MSIEAKIRIAAIFPSEDSAKIATSVLKKSLNKNDHELAKALNALNPIENQENYQDEHINVEEIKRKNCTLTINSYTYTSEQPTWFAKSLAQLGAERIHIVGNWDGHVQNYYFLEGEKVQKKVFVGEPTQKIWSEKDIEINKGLFLPDGRVTVKAKLVSTWVVGDIYENIGMKFVTTSGDEFFYKGRGRLLETLWNSKTEKFDTSMTIEFSAVFEREMHEKSYASFAKRPTKIVKISEST